jgi:ribosomal protein S12 methylthiotransferase
LKIADGCNNRCTFCAIPSIRGAYRSRRIEGLVSETERLTAEYGVKELILVAQDTTRYGVDLYGAPALAELIDRLSATDAEWIRILYAYPEMLDDALIDRLAENRKVVKYLDIPLQHAADGVLKRMGRRNDKKYAVELIEKLKKAGFAIRTTFITGFPGETEADVDELVAFIRETKLDHIGFFAYSKEEGTPAARMKEQIPERVKKARLSRLLSAGTEVMTARAKEYIGKTLKIICEGADFERDLFYGRSQYQAPEIDGVVYIAASDTAMDAGGFYEVSITDSDKFDLIGELKQK